MDVKIVGWAVLDKSVLQDLQPDEVVYDNLISDYDSTYDTSNGVDTIPDKLPSAPSEISRFAHFADSSYVYPNGLDSRFDMYLWGTQGFPNIGGCGGDWGQRLSDTAYLNMLDGTGIHVLEHEIGHGFGMTDFYGGEGESNGFPSARRFPRRRKFSDDGRLRHEDHRLRRLDAAVYVEQDQRRGRTVLEVKRYKGTPSARLGAGGVFVSPGHCTISVYCFVSSCSFWLIFRIFRR